jgi:hypothetical protein
MTENVRSFYYFDVFKEKYEMLGQVYHCVPNYWQFECTLSGPADNITQTIDAYEIYMYV